MKQKHDSKHGGSTLGEHGGTPVFRIYPIR